MGKRVVLSIFGGIALLGLIVMIVGVAMGGRPGSINVVDGNIAYVNSKETIPITGVPYWMRNWGTRYNSHVPAMTDTPTTPGTPDAPAEIPTGNGKTFTMGDPLPEGQTLTGLEIDIDAGYVIILPGPEPGMEVDGNMTYTTTTEGGVWKIESKHNSVTSRGIGRFWLNGQDITTTFTITVPERFLELDIELGMGEVDVQSITVDELDGKVDLGTLTLNNVTAADSELTVNMGAIQANELSTDICELECDMGSIEMSGFVGTQLKAKCAMGGIFATLDRPDGYSVTSDVSLGSIEVDGTHHGAGFTSGSHFSEGDGSTQFDLECGMGSIEIMFR